VRLFYTYRDYYCLQLPFDVNNYIMRFLTATSDYDSIVSCSSSSSIAVVISALHNRRSRCSTIATLSFALTVVIRSVDVVNAAAAATGGIDLREIRGRTNQFYSEPSDCNAVPQFPLTDNAISPSTVSHCN
jgi:hypothetical protein